jgi:FkbM family methyltransferase
MTDRVSKGLFESILALHPVTAKARRTLQYTRYNLRDIYDSYVAPPSRPQPTPFGFLFGGLASRHHRDMQQGVFEAVEARMIQRLLGVADALIDVGANVGYYTCIARAMGKRVIAVEPLPVNLRALFENLRVNSWEDTEVWPLGLSDHVGIATLFGSSSTGASLIDAWGGAPSLIKRSIPISTLDTLLGERFAGSRLLIKMDVEGHEYSSLKGSLALLGRQVKPIWLVEIALDQYHPAGQNPHFAATFELFWKNGYSAFVLCAAGLEAVSQADVRDWVSRRRPAMPEVNYVFVPADAAQLVSDVTRAT